MWAPKKLASDALGLETRKEWERNLLTIGLMGNNNYPATSPFHRDCAVLIHMLDSHGTHEAVTQVDFEHHAPLGLDRISHFALSTYLAIQQTHEDKTLGEH